MPSRLRILMLSAEVAPFAKTGGLGDVAGALPKALGSARPRRARGHARLPGAGARRAIGRGRLRRGPGRSDRSPRERAASGGGPPDGAPGSDVPSYLIAERSLFDRPNIYGYDDDPYRFAFFARAALELSVAWGWRPDVVHGHDWHAAPAVMWLATAGRGDDRFSGVATVFTIHNLAHQGRSSRRVPHYLGVDVPPLHEEAGWDEVNFMARGIYHATLVNTVSRTYAREIMTPGGRQRPRRAAQRPAPRRPRHLERTRRRRLEPATDARLVETFDVSSPQQRRGEQARACSSAWG